MEEIEEFFDIEPSENSLTSHSTPMDKMPAVIQHDNVQDNAKDDYHQTRESLKHMIRKGTEMIDKLAVVAGESESPRAFEVMGGYLKQIAEMNKMLMEMNKDAKEILEKEKTDDDKAGDTYVFYGTTEDLQKAIKEK
jgi:vacuolar-type H+-ATPase subunit B/Vma2